MSKFMFGVTVTPGRLPREWRQRRARVAKKLSCLFVEIRDGDGSYRSWFEADNRGEPHNTHVAVAVHEELEDKA